MQLEVTTYGGSIRGHCFYGYKNMYSTKVVIVEYESKDIFYLQMMSLRLALKYFLNGIYKNGTIYVTESRLLQVAHNPDLKMKDKYQKLQSDIQRLIQQIQQKKNIYNIVKSKNENDDAESIRSFYRDRVEKRLDRKEAIKLARMVRQMYRKSKRKPKPSSNRNKRKS